MKTTKRLIALLISLLLILNLSSCNLLVDFLWGEIEEPLIKYGEFPFELVCEIDGQEVTYKDTLIIEHAGDKYLFEYEGRHNEWNRSLLNSSIDPFGASNGFNIKKGITKEGYEYKISFFLGTSSYYMGVEETGSSVYARVGASPGDFILFCDELGDYYYGYGPIDEQTLYEEYGIKVIKKILPEPLKDNVK